MSVIFIKKIEEVESIALPKRYIRPLQQLIAGASRVKTKNVHKISSILMHFRFYIYDKTDNSSD